MKITKEIADATKLFLKDIMNIPRAFSSLTCSVFGHKPGSKTIIAYELDERIMIVTTRIYQVQRCPKCGKIYFNKINSYDRLSWYTDIFGEKEEHNLREKGFVTIAEAYQLLS